MLEIFQWVSWLSVYKYSIEILMVNEFYGFNFMCFLFILGKGILSVFYLFKVGEIYVFFFLFQVREFYMFLFIIVKEFYVFFNYVR